MHEVEAVLDRLALLFTARDIMTPHAQLVCGGTEHEARVLLHQHPEFDVIPILDAGIPIAYVRRGTVSMRRIGLDDIISESLGILPLIDGLKQQRFYFVFGNHRITGYIHFSDLNHQIVKLPLFVLLEAVERRLLGHIEQHVTEELVSTTCGSRRAKVLLRQLEEQRKKDADLGLAHLLSFREVVAICQHLELTALAQAEMDALVRVRNRVAHSSRPLIRSYADVGRLGHVGRQALQLLGR